MAKRKTMRGRTNTIARYGYDPASNIFTVEGLPYPRLSAQDYANLAGEMLNFFPTVEQA